MSSASRLIWINGPFGGGKTSVAKALVRQLDGAVFFDPERIGVLLREIVPASTGDFQDLPQWRDLWVRTASTLIDHGTAVIVMPMTVTRREYYLEVNAGLHATGAQVNHVVLDASRAALERRIEHNVDEPPRTRGWRMGKLPEFLAARPWLLAAADLAIATDDCRSKARQPESRSTSS